VSTQNKYFVARSSKLTFTPLRLCLLLGTALGGAGSAVSPARADGTDVAIPAVSVEGQATQDTSVQGYVAKRSTAGTKTSTRLVETPQSISVIPHDELVQQDAQTLNQALHYTAGVATETRGGIATRYDLLTIRGFNADYYLDGMKLLNNGWYIAPQIDPYLLERIDVVKGTSSVLYGSAEAGGLIDQISKKPLETPYHEVGLELGTDGHYEATFDFSGPLDAAGKTLYRVTGIGNTENGQIATTKNQRLAIAPALTWQPDADTSLTVSMMYQYDPKSTSYGSVPPQGTVLPSSFGTLPRDFYDGDADYEKFNRTEISLGYDFSKQLDDGLLLRSKARWFHTDQNYESVYSQGLEADGHTLARGTADSRDSADQFTTDNSLEAHVQTGPVQNDLLFGTDYQHLSSHWVSGFGSAPGLDIFDPVAAQPVTPPSTTLEKAHLNQFGVYAQDQAKFAGFVLTLSGREDWAETYESDADYGTRTDQFARAFTGRAGLNYLFGNGVAPYVSYSESFNPILGTNATGEADRPETGQQYEAGVKYQPPGTKTLLTAAVFNLVRQNLVTPDLANPALSVQSGEARSRGVELEGRTSLTDHLDVIATYTYLNTIYTKDNSGLQDKYLPAVPQNEASAWADYRMPPGLLDGLSVGGGVRYIGTTYNDLNTFTVKTATLVDGTLGYDLGVKQTRLKGATLYLNGRNLLDKTYVASCYYGSWCAYGYGRQVMGGIRYNW
jgi:iron complex outermembrane receptor protein